MLLTPATPAPTSRPAGPGKPQNAIQKVMESFMSHDSAHGALPTLRAATALDTTTGAYYIRARPHVRPQGDPIAIQLPKTSSGRSCSTKTMGDRRTADRNNMASIRTKSSGVSQELRQSSDQPTVLHPRPRSWFNFLRSCFDGLPSGSTSNCIITRRSSATFRRNSRLASVSRYSVCATDAGPAHLTQQ